jgi:putative ABC transport system ATP-binding protein
MPAELIELREAYKTYRIGTLEVPAVRGVSLTIGAGEFAAVMGPSGSGKSTLMHLIGCLDRLDRGQYRFEGRPIEQLSRTQLAALRSRRIGFVFQSFNLLRRTSIVDNVAMPLMYQGVRRRERRRRAAALLDRMGLGDRAHHQPNQLSGGQQQRVAIARALIASPAIVLADEPTGNLDSHTSAEIMSLLATINREQGVTIVLVTHEADIAAYARRQIIVRDGRISHDDVRPLSGAA